MSTENPSLAYVISEFEVLDEEAMNSYRQNAAPSVAKYGGRYLARNVEGEVWEGNPAQGRFVLIEFPSLALAHQWYASPEYAEALKFREKASVRRLLVVEGKVTVAPAR